jgi:hypothetical protein
MGDTGKISSSPLVGYKALREGALFSLFNLQNDSTFNF